MHRDQGGGAGGVHADGGAAEIVHVGHAVSDDGAGGAGQGVGVCLGGIGGNEHAVIIIRGTHIHADRLAAQGISGNPRVLQGLPGEFQHQALLGVNIHGFQW